MLPFKLVYSEKYFLPIGEHVFRADKFRLVIERLLEQGAIDHSDIIEPSPASEQDVMLVHSPHYVNKLMEGSLSVREELQMEIPYSPQVVDAFLLHAGGSVRAAERALEDGVCINVGGGFHHAFPDHGEGFCMINDIAVAIRAMQKRGRIQRAMTVDCDVHQGNGTAAIFSKPAQTCSDAALGFSANHRRRTRRDGTRLLPGRLHHLVASGKQLPVREAGILDRREPSGRL